MGSEKIIVGIIGFLFFLVIASVYNENEALKAQSRRKSKESYKGFFEEITDVIFFGIGSAIPFFFGFLILSVPVKIFFDLN